MTDRLPIGTGAAIYCDDIRQEMGGKLSYMGVYKGALVLPAPPPAAMPKFFIMVLFNFPLTDEEHSVQVRLYFPGNDDDKKPNHVVDVPAPGVDDQPPPWLSDAQPATLMRTLSLPMGFSPLVIEKTGRFRVRIAKGDTLYRLESLNIIVADDASSAIGSDGEST